MLKHWPFVSDSVDSSGWRSCLEFFFPCELNHDYEYSLFLGQLIK